MREGEKESVGMEAHYASRNDSLEFAKRTRKNFEHIERAFQAGEDVHVVTQLATSLLGLIVFPWEKQFDRRIKTQRLDELVKAGWPAWQVSEGTSSTLGELVRHLRNAVAHGHLTFSSDSRHINEVAIEFADYESKRPEPDWAARIETRDLRTFCLKFIELLEISIN